MRLPSATIILVMDQRFIKFFRRGQIIRLIAVLFFSVWLSGCGNLVTVVTATLEPTSNATPAIAQTSTVTQSADIVETTQVTRTPKATRTPRATRTPGVTVQSTAPADVTPTPLPATIDGFRVATPDNLPPEARHTLALIDKGGPFPYRQDGVVFQNREGILPRKSSSYYHEYTVVTPGSPDRGARRIIIGGKGEIYYTKDHYATFVRVIRP